jgi:hypothetical protein
LFDKLNDSHWVVLLHELLAQFGNRGLQLVHSVLPRIAVISASLVFQPAPRPESRAPGFCAP